MKRTNMLVLLLSSVILSAMAVGCIGSSETVKIGLLAPQTGPIAQYAP